MINEFKEIDQENIPEVVKMFSNNLQHHVHTENEIREEIRRIVDDVADELITKAAAAATNKEVGAGDVGFISKNEHNKSFMEKNQHGRGIEDWIKSQAELRKLYQNSKEKELPLQNNISRNYTITRGRNDNNEPFITWELNYPTYAMVKVVKIGPKDRIIHSNGVLDSEEVKKIVAESDEILNKKKGVFSRIRKMFRRMWRCVA